ncbi:glycoside hydrolase family 16 protein [Hydnum rufescens UP504]|uniref:Glycoside hydrolase family 16 protein n=1 Tax=Hydnum rufescens UP504 TaxID=1448309 RepID=A0A9P6B523_9AGAM|nr:glycoside hydrolase family 16 protein [Hydnum rufescens UP504]
MPGRLIIAAAGFFAFAVFSTRAFGGVYRVSDSFVGPSFYNGFDAVAIPDPTEGRVNYVDTQTAIKLNLTYAYEDTFILRADYTTTLTATGPGRNSVRLSSKKKYTQSVLVADIRHMPQGCGTWPALWTYTRPWPSSGEIDIVEGVNDQGPNQATLHTSPGCTQPDSRLESGEVVSLNCDATVNNNQGCGVKSTDPASYGPPFNAIGGGWYAMERTSSSISVWFWRRDDPSVPWSVQMGLSDLDTFSFGVPFGTFVCDNCPIPEYFAAHNIIINLTLCGSWAGQPDVFQAAGCPGSCVDYVNNNPAAFKDAYWDFASLKVYTPLLESRFMTAFLLYHC